ncbi:MAG: hypothetical protein NTW29_05510 [Bacteroidetes bacterium]|nr:hypothetical protein [Bacteroidota bacterium]
MNHPKFHIIRNMIGKKLIVLSLIAATGFASFATLGDGNKNAVNSPRKSFLSNRGTNKPGTFSLRSNYNFRGSQLLNTGTEKRYIRLNTIATIQKGNTTYIVPLKRKVGIGNVKIDLGNRQFQRN